VYYIVNQQADDVDAIWITEVWENEADHDASLEIPGVRELIGEAMPILAGPPEAGVKLTVLGGKGIDH
jgi:quinol monooxygenase YgiN